MQQQAQQQQAQQQQAQQQIDRLTQVLDAYKNQDWGTDADVAANVWPNLLQYVYDNKNNLTVELAQWKYYNEYTVTELGHANGQQTFPLLPWPNSFALALLFAIYH